MCLSCVMEVKLICIDKWYCCVVVARGDQRLMTVTNFWTSWFLFDRKPTYGNGLIWVVFVGRCSTTQRSCHFQAEQIWVRSRRLWLNWTKMSPLYYALLLFVLTSIYVGLDAHGNLSLTETAAANSSVLYRVEIELLRLENPNGTATNYRRFVHGRTTYSSRFLNRVFYLGISEDGLACDPLSLGCNTKVSAYLDT